MADLGRKDWQGRGQAQIPEERQETGAVPHWRRWRTMGKYLHIVL